jgi:two-component system sensor histidine kinase PilS (NtrC family)
MIDPFKTDSEQSKLILKRFALARAAIIIGVALSCTGLHISSGARIDLNSAYLIAVLFIALTGSLIAALMLTTDYSPTMRFSFLLLCADIVIISGIVMLTGGNRSVFVLLYLVAILSSSILFSFDWSLLFATVCSMCFILVVLLEQNGVIATASAFRNRAAPMSTGDLWAYTAMKIFAFYLTAFLSGYLSRRIGLLQSFQQNILSSFSSGFISVNRDCIVTYLNSSGADILRRPSAKCIGRHVSSVLPMGEGKPNLLEEAVAGQKELRGKEIEVDRGDGERIPVGITISTLKNTSNKNLGAIASFIDLTELKRMEEMLRLGDRLTAVGEMSASLAHEIRNPVASIRGAVQEMAEGFEGDGAQAQLMDIVIKESDQLSKIVTDFLDFVGTGRCEKEQVEIRQLMEEIVGAAKRYFICNGEIEIVSEYADDLGVMRCDRGQVREAMLNVIQNGIEAMSRGGALHVRANQSEISRGQIFISIQDEGDGFSPDAKEKIFEPFYTTKRNGTGLGMAIAHRIVTAHGGSMDISSDNGKGTTVTIELPRGV